MQRSRARERTLNIVISVAVTVAAVGGLGGCYKRVVREDRGIGRKSDRVYESNLESSRVPVIDNLIDYVDPDAKPRPKTKTKRAPSP